MSRCWSPFFFTQQKSNLRLDLVRAAEQSDGCKTTQKVATNRRLAERRVPVGLRHAVSGAALLQLLGVQSEGIPLLQNCRLFWRQEGIGWQRLSYRPENLEAGRVILCQVLWLLTIQVLALQKLLEGFPQAKVVGTRAGPSNTRTNCGKSLRLRRSGKCTRCLDMTNRSGFCGSAGEAVETINHNINFPYAQVAPPTSLPGIPWRRRRVWRQSRALYVPAGRLLGLIETWQKLSVR